MSREQLNWTWLALLVAISIVRKSHERNVGPRLRIKGMPIDEATIMILWGITAGVLPVVYVLSAWLDFADFPFALPQMFPVVGIAMFASAIWLLHRSHIDLGRHWSPIVEFRPDHLIVTDGVYKWVRHPMYSAHVLWGVGQALFFPNFIVGPLSLILMLGILGLRIPREERAMLNQFGASYDEYVKRTGCLAPRWPLGRNRRH